MHDYLPDFIIRLNAKEERYLILETKGYDPIEEVKSAATERWANAVNSDGKFGQWIYRLVRQPVEIPNVLEGAAVCFDKESDL